MDDSEFSKHFGGGEGKRHGTPTRTESKGLTSQPRTPANMQSDDASRPGFNYSGANKGEQARYRQMAKQAEAAKKK